MTYKRLLQIALQPVGQTLYVWGGGWNAEDTAAGIDAVTIGVSPRWREFYQAQPVNYNYETTRYQIHDGLDCTGYLGWVIYNLLETASGNAGYVYPSGMFVDRLAQRGLGTVTRAAEVHDFLPCDVMGKAGHVYMVVGACADGSMVLLHASPPGVQLCGAPENSHASRLAAFYMYTYVPKWHEAFPCCSRGGDYLTEYDQMRWSVLSDPEQYTMRSADEILRDLFEKD